jgi:hypothetical protein
VQTTKRAFVAAVTALTVLMAGCATPPQAPIAWNSTAIKAAPGKVGVVMSSLPAPNTQFPGASCLLCIAFAEAANSEMTAHVKTLSLNDLKALSNDVAVQLRKQGLDVTVFPEPLAIDSVPERNSPSEGEARRDFASLRAKLNVDRLLVLDFPVVAVQRNYSAYIPQGAPFAAVRGTASMVDLRNNKLLWNQQVGAVVTPQDKWDEPPKFPGVTNAWYQALENAKDSVVKALAP